MNMYISIKNEEQLEKVTRQLPDAMIIVPVMFAVNGILQKADIQPGRIYLSFSEVLRENRISALNLHDQEDISSFAGVMIKNIDELGLVLKSGYQGKVIADSSLYAYNLRAAGAYFALHPHMLLVLPDELSDDELVTLAGNINKPDRLIYKVYGRQRLMTTAQDLPAFNKSDSGRGGDGYAMSFVNERRDSFISLWNPVSEYTEIFNAAPTSVLDKADRLKWQNALAELTTENGRELDTVISAVSDFVAGREAQMLKGAVRGYHFKGVE